MYNYVNGKVPNILKTFFTPAKISHSHNTRNTLLFKPPLMKSKVGIKSIFKTGIDQWGIYVNQAEGNHLSIHQAKRLIIANILSTYV